MLWVTGISIIAVPVVLGIYLAWQRQPKTVEEFDYDEGIFREVTKEVPVHVWWNKNARVALPIYGLAVLVALGGWIGYDRYQDTRPPIKFIILVADFDDPEPSKNRVTATLLNRLREALAPYDDSEVVALGQTITEAEGSEKARTEGEQ